MHLRSPSVDKGSQAFVWAIVFFLIIFFGGKAIGIAGGTAFLVAAVSAFFIYLFIRTHGAKTTTGEF